jgi:hypothetical protein
MFGQLPEWFGLAGVEPDPSWLGAGVVVVDGVVVVVDDEPLAALATAVPPAARAPVAARATAACFKRCRMMLTSLPWGLPVNSRGLWGS